jgi:hypothetical protein
MLELRNILGMQLHLFDETSALTGEDHQSA